jgi:predicted kinase
VDAIYAKTQMIVFTGLPGPGKSMLAEQVAPTVGAPAFAGDWHVA